MPFLACVGALVLFSLVAGYNRRFIPVLESLDLPLPGVTEAALDVGELLLGPIGWLGPLALLAVAYLPIALGARGPRVQRGYLVAAAFLALGAVGSYLAVQLPIAKIQRYLDAEPVSAPR